MRARFVVLCIALGACSRSSTSPAAASSSAAAPSPVSPATLPEVAAGPEEGFHDLTFALVDRGALPTGSTRLRAQGKRGEDNVQFDIELASEWKVSDQPPLRILSGVVAVERIGNDSSLVHLLDDVYKTELEPKEMKETTTLAAVALQGDPRVLDRGPVQLKLFYEGKDDTEYAELFLNVDAAKRVVEIREKDPDYRVAVVRAFSR